MRVFPVPHHIWMRHLLCGSFSCKANCWWDHRGRRLVTDIVRCNCNCKFVDYRSAGYYFIHDEKLGIPAGYVSVLRTLRVLLEVRGHTSQLNFFIPGQMTSAWDQAYSQLQLFHAKQGCLPRKDEGPLGRWCSAQRLRLKRGQLGPYQQAKLEQIPGWLWSSESTEWSKNYNKLVDFHNRHGKVPGRQYTGKLGEWCKEQREKPQRKTLSTRGVRTFHVWAGITLVMVTLYLLL